MPDLFLVYHSLIVRGIVWFWVFFFFFGVSRIYAALLLYFFLPIRELCASCIFST